MELNKILTEITGYSKLVLETRVQNTHAIEFYESLGYQHCEAYGKYVGKQNAYCCEKLLYKVYTPTII